jgi:hypothetical protein
MRPSSREWLRGAIRAAGCVAVTIALAAPREAGATPPDDTRVSPEGRRYRVRFNPAGRIWVGFYGAFGHDADDDAQATGELNLGISYRNLTVAGRGGDQIIWQIDHRFLAGWLWPLRRELEGVPVLDATLYSASFHRHDESPHMVLPFSPPISLPFPFDVGFETEVGRVFVPAYLPAALSDGEPVPRVGVGVLRASLFLDPWRSGRPGQSLEIGVGARYDVDVIGSPTLDSPKIVHRVAPLTAASLRFRFQTDDGLSVFETRGDFIPHWTSEKRWAFAATANAHVERTLIAVNDQPVAAVLEGGYRRTASTDETEKIDDVRVTLGLAFNLQLQ